MLTITPGYAAILGLMLVALGARTLLLRRRLKVGVGDSNSDGEQIALTRAIRAHGNFAEYVPMAVLLVALLEIRSGPDLIVHLLLAALVLGRVVHAVGISRDPEDYRFRVVGMATTFSVLLLTSVRLILSYLG